MLFIWWCTSIPLGLSVARMGGLTWIIRHWGSAVFSWVMGCCFVGVVLAGWVGALQWASVATWAQEGWVGAYVIFLTGCGSWGSWGCMVSGVKLLFLSSSLTIFLVR